MDLFLFLGNKQVQRIQRLAGDVLLDVGVFFFYQSKTRCLGRKFDVLVGQTDFFGGRGDGR